VLLYRNGGYGPFAGRLTTPARIMLGGVVGLRRAAELIVGALGGRACDVTDRAMHKVEFLHHFRGKLEGIKVRLTHTSI